MARHIDTADCAKLVRKALKEAFPTIKFSVRISRYSGGSSIDIDWFDGPTEQEVNRVAGWYKGADFDGSIDLKTYHDSELNGEKVSFGADYIHCHRKYTNAFLTRRAEAVARRFGCKMPTISPDSKYGSHVSDDGERIGSEYVSWVVMRQAARTRVAAGE